MASSRAVAPLPLPAAGVSVVRTSLQPRHAKPSRLAQKPLLHRKKVSGLDIYDETGLDDLCKSSHVPVCQVDAAVRFC